MYVLPDAYEGNAVILFDQPGGAPTEYSAGYRVYRIPPNGILKTTSKSDHGGFAVIKFCYASRFQGVGPTPNNAYLPYVNALRPTTSKLATTTIVAFNYGGFTQSQAHIDIFSVSRVAKADSIFEHREALVDQVLPPFPPEADSLDAPPRKP